MCDIDVSDVDDLLVAETGGVATVDRPAVKLGILAWPKYKNRPSLRFQNVLFDFPPPFDQETLQRLAVEVRPQLASALSEV
jgi:hypothetical protein